MSKQLQRARRCFSLLTQKKSELEDDAGIKMWDKIRTFMKYNLFRSASRKTWSYGAWKYTQNADISIEL